MIAIRMKKFYKKTGRRVWIDGNKLVGFDKKKLECFKCHNTGHFARECPSKRTNDGKKRDFFYQDQGARKKEQNQNCLLTMDDGVVNWGEHTVEEEETNHALMAISSNNGVSLLYRRILPNKPLYSRFSKTNNFKGVPHPLYGDYTPKPQEEIDDSLYVYGKKGPQKPEISDSDDNSTEHSTCQSNDSEGSFGNPSEHSSESESESISVPNEMSTSKSVTTNEKVVSESKEVEPSCATHVKTPRQQMKNQGIPEVKGKNWNKIMEKELGEGYSFIKKKCFVYGSLSHLIKDCDFYEKKMAREAELKKQRVFTTGNGVAKPVWKNANRVNRANHFIPRPVQLNTGRENVNFIKSNVNSVRHNVNSDRTNVNTSRSKQPDHPLKNMEDRGYKWMFDIDYLTDSMNYIPVSLDNQTNPHAGTSEVTNNAETLPTPNANASEEEDAAKELIVVPTAVKHTTAKVRPRMSSTNSKAKAEAFLIELQHLKTQEKEAYSTGISEDTPEF
ncbi:ribonuclease H-like domain-containing protein [Tanacetum coccineum]